MTYHSRRWIVGMLGALAGMMIASGLGFLCAQTGCGTASSTTETALPTVHAAKTADDREYASNIPAKTIADTAAGTLSIEGSAVSCTVARLGDAMPDSFYLTHALDGSWSSLGCPFLDRRSATGGVHLLVYGHHFAGSNVMFGSLWECYAQERFAQLGTARWMPASESEAVLYAPYCALRMPAAYGTIQRFSFPNEGDLECWLHELAKEANALSPAWEEQATRATGALTTVTCTEGNGASKHRTIVVFTTA